MFWSLIVAAIANMSNNTARMVHRFAASNISSRSEGGRVPGTANSRPCIKLFIRTGLEVVDITMWSCNCNHGDVLESAKLNSRNWIRMQMMDDNEGDMF